MAKAKIMCEQCNKEYIIDVEYPSDLFGVECPKCNTSEFVFILDNGFPNDGKTIKLGIHTGCSQK